MLGWLKDGKQLVLSRFFFFKEPLTLTPVAPIGVIAHQVEPWRCPIWDEVTECH